MMFDQDALLNGATLDVWGVVATYEPRKSAPTGASFAVKGAFTREPVSVLTQIADSELQGPGHSSTHIVFGVRRVDLPRDPKAGDRLTVNGKSFEVWDIQPDTTGFIELVLRERVGA